MSKCIAFGTEARGSGACMAIPMRYDRRQPYSEISETEVFSRVNSSDDTLR